MKFPVDASRRRVVAALTMRAICTQAQIPRGDFLRAYGKS